MNNKCGKFLMAAGLALAISSTPAVAEDASQVLCAFGNNARMTVPSAPDLQNASGFTIEAWVYPVYTKNTRILVKGDGSSSISENSYDFGWNANWNTPGNSGFEFDVYPSSDRWGLIFAPAKGNQWWHVAFTYSRDLGRMCIYLNGKLASTSTTDVLGRPMAGLSVRPSPNYPLVVGCCPWFSNSECLIDDLMVWTVARTEDEVRGDQVRAAFVNEPALAARWTFNGGTGSDSTGKGHSGVISQFASVPSAFIPRPTVPASNMAVRLTEIEVSWDAFLNERYQVQYSTNLINWINWKEPLLATNTIMGITDSIPDVPHRFYRALLAP